jgi:hypothetical protein
LSPKAGCGVNIDAGWASRIASRRCPAFASHRTGPPAARGARPSLLAIGQSGLFCGFPCPHCLRSPFR